jgi:hypothetical protein
MESSKLALGAALPGLLNDFAVPQGEGFQVTPAPQKWLANGFPRPGPYSAPYVKGGAYLAEISGALVDVSGETFRRGTIEVRPGGFGELRISAEKAMPATRRDGVRFRINLFKKKVGWKWVEVPDDREWNTIISIQSARGHHYAICLDIWTPVTLMREADKKSEPRLRPSTYGVLSSGEPVGLIWVPGALGGKRHPIFGRSVIS